VSDAPALRLSRAEITVLTFAARRQLTRWARRTDLQPPQLEQRAMLIRAVRTLEDPALAGGCELRAGGGGE
jgi:hypothetical protein